MDFADVEVLLDNPKLKRPVRCGKKFSKGAARKLKASEIIFICKGGGKYAHLGRQARDNDLLKTVQVLSHFGIQNIIYAPRCRDLRFKWFYLNHLNFDEEHN